MIQEYLQYITTVRGLSPLTVENYGKDLRQFATWAEGRGLRWSTITERDVDAWIAEQAVAGLKPRTRNRRLSALRGLLTWAHHKGLLEENVSRFCQSAKVAERLPQALDVRAVDAFLASDAFSTEKRIGQLLVALMVESGLRIQEAIDVRREDIDDEQRSISVRGKGGKERIVFYGERTARQLASWLTPFDGRLLPDWEQRRYRDIIERVMAPYVGKMHPHQLRHTFGTAALNAGMPITTVSALMGHKRVETTQIYARVARETARQEYLTYKF